MPHSLHHFHHMLHAPALPAMEQPTLLGMTDMTEPVPAQLLTACRRVFHRSSGPAAACFFCLCPFRLRHTVGSSSDAAALLHSDVRSWPSKFCLCMLLLLRASFSARHAISLQAMYVSTVLYLHQTVPRKPSGQHGPVTSTVYRSDTHLPRHDLTKDPSTLSSIRALRDPILAPGSFQNVVECFAVMLQSLAKSASGFWKRGILS